MIKELFQIKKLITLLLTLVFCYLAVIRIITSDQYLTVFSLVIAFYFGQSTVRQAVSESSERTVNPVADSTKIMNDIK
ncbi:hypothetical protein [Clostridium sp.]|uniref:hypothetical protein n=1 Tax=Clostridium sp. TaxID=1506 RepID=UPI003D6D156F